MYIRKKTMRSKSKGKLYVYYQLVETARTPDGPRVRIISHLGVLDITDPERKLLSDLVDRKARGLSNSVRFSEKIEQLAEQIYLKYLLSRTLQDKESQNEVKVERQAIIPEGSISFTRNCIEIGYHRTAGAEFVGLRFWELLKLDNVLRDCSFSDKEIELSKIAILGRLISPGSECHITRWYNKQSSLSEHLKVLQDKVSKDSLYRIGDKLLKNKKMIESLVRPCLKRLHSLIDVVYLYDLTNTYFEGNKAKSKLCKRAKSKEKRDDCPLVTLALVVDQEGFPVLSRIYKGNQSEPKTLKEILVELYAGNDDLIDKIAKPSIIMDRGIATKENIRYLRDHHYSYFVVERRNSVKDFSEEFSDLSAFEEHSVSGENSIYLKRYADEKTAKVLVYSTGKSVKETQIMSNRETRFLDEAQQLILSNQKGNIKDSDKILVRIGRLKEKHSAIACKFHFQLERDVSNHQLVKQIKLNPSDNAPTKSEFPGCYVIETDVLSLNAKQIWDFYTNLTEVEAAFKSLKSELGTRPIHHQRDGRVESHLFISVLAYSILKSITYTLRKKGYSKTWTSIKLILSTHMRSSILISDIKGHRHHIRQTSFPEAETKEIFNMLNVRITKNQVKHKLHL
jgi:transposase